MKQIAAGIGIVLLLLVGAYQYGKSQAKVITETKEVEKVVEKRNVITVTKEVTKPDGTKEKTTVVEDKTQTSSVVEKSASTKKPDWFVAAGAAVGIDIKPVYMVEANRRVLGDVFVGVYGTTDKQVGLKVGLEF